MMTVCYSYFSAPYFLASVLVGSLVGTFLIVLKRRWRRLHLEVLAEEFAVPEIAGFEEEDDELESVEDDSTSVEDDSTYASSGSEGSFDVLEEDEVYYY